MDLRIPPFDVLTTPYANAVPNYERKFKHYGSRDSQEHVDTIFI